MRPLFLCVVAAFVIACTTAQHRVPLENDVPASRPVGWEKAGLLSRGEEESMLQLTFAVKQNNTAALFELLDKTSDPGEPLL